jgi:adenylate kinase family enzyme
MLQYTYIDTLFGGDSMDDTDTLFPYRRVAVIGCPGSGKSTFSRALRDLAYLPLYHLDAIYWKRDQSHIPEEDFQTLQRLLLSLDEWIIDGNYNSTLEWRIAACDLLIFLDYPAEVCLEGVRSRLGQKRQDMAWVEKAEDPKFMTFIRAFETESRPRILELIGKYPDKAVVTFRTREDADKYLSSLVK